MDLAQLEAEMTELQRRYREWRKPLTEAYKRFAHLPDDEADQKLWEFYHEQLRVYNPWQAVFPVREKMLALYLAATRDEREQLRALVIKVDYFGNVFYKYIFQCIECMESPDDGELLFMALVAASLEGCSSDFRDFDAVLAELAMAARETGIDIEPHAKAAAALADDRPSRGACYPSVQARLVKFAEYAKTAKHLF